MLSLLRASGAAAVAILMIKTIGLQVAFVCLVVSTLDLGVPSVQGYLRYGHWPYGSEGFFESLRALIAVGFASSLLTLLIMIRDRR